MCMALLSWLTVFVAQPERTSTTLDKRHLHHDCRLCAHFLFWLADAAEGLGYLPGVVQKWNNPRRKP